MNVALSKPYPAPVNFAVWGEKIDRGENKFAVRKANGKVVALTPNGEFEERDEIGPWETFDDSESSAYVADRDNPNPFVGPKVEW